MHALNFVGRQKVIFLENERNHKMLVVDTPSLEESEGADANHIISMVKFIKENIKSVHLILFVVKDVRFDNPTRKLLKVFSNIFGE